MIDESFPAYLSAAPEKRDLYRSDTYFREGLEDLRAVAGQAVEQFCHDHTLLLLKPDAVVTHRLRPALRWVAERGFSIVGAHVAPMNRHSIRALWQYGLNAASRDRRDAADLYVTATDCLLVIMAMRGQEQPAATVLSQVKGPPDPALCRPGQLRHDLGSLNYQLNLVHAADEPADFIRELAILCDHETRTALLRSALDREDASSRAWTLAEGLESGPAMRLELDHTLSALASAADAGALNGRYRSGKELHTLIADVRAGRSRDWRRLLRLAADHGVRVTRWQQIVLSTHLLDPNTPGVTSLLPDASYGR